MRSPFPFITIVRDHLFIFAFIPFIQAIHQQTRKKAHTMCSQRKKKIKRNKSMHCVWIIFKLWMTSKDYDFIVFIYMVHSVWTSVFFFLICEMCLESVNSRTLSCPFVFYPQTHTNCNFDLKIVQVPFACYDYAFRLLGNFFTIYSFHSVVTERINQCIW